MGTRGQERHSQWIDHLGPPQNSEIVTGRLLYHSHQGGHPFFIFIFPFQSLFFGLPIPLPLQFKSTTFQKFPNAEPSMFHFWLHPEWRSPFLPPIPRTFSPSPLRLALSRIRFFRLNGIRSTFTMVTTLSTRFGGALEVCRVAENCYLDI